MSSTVHLKTECFCRKITGSVAMEPQIYLWDRETKLKKAGNYELLAVIKSYSSCYCSHCTFSEPCTEGWLREQLSLSWF